MFNSTIKSSLSYPSFIFIFLNSFNKNSSIHTSSLVSLTNPFFFINLNLVFYKSLFFFLFLLADTGTINLYGQIRYIEIEVFD